MRKKISIVIIISASLSSIIMTIPVWFFGGAPIFFRTLDGFTILCIVFWIIIITFLIRLKNWARIAYIIIHIILALFTVNIYIILTTSFPSSLNENIVASLIFLLPFSYFIIAIIYFLRSDTAKLFKQ